MNYVLIYKDNKNYINYYYNFTDNLVYTSNNKNNKCNLLGMIGIIVGFIFYLLIATISYYIPYSYLFIIIIGIIFGLIITFIANKTITDIFKDKGKKLSKKALKDMYMKNKTFRIKYFILTISFFILSISSLILYKNTLAINFITFTSIIMATFLLFLYRPINNYKFLKLIK